MLVEELIVEGIRKDFRTVTENREVSIKHYPNILEITTPGSAVIMIYKKGTTTPYPDRPSEGIFQLTLNGRKNDLLLNFLHNVYIKSRCVTLDMIKFNQTVESLTININIIETDGDLFRLCIEGINKIIKILDLKATFLPQYFRFCSIFDNIIQDPTNQELQHSDWSVHVVKKSTREILYIEKTGIPTDPSEVLKAVRLAFENSKKVQK